MVSPYFIPGEYGHRVLIKDSARAPGVRTIPVLDQFAGVDRRTAGLCRLCATIACALLQAGVRLYEISPDARPATTSSSDASASSSAGCTRRPR